MVTRGREFPNSKAAGRNDSEPMCSLVNVVEKPTLWSKGEGRWVGVVKTEVTLINSRGSRVGMLTKIHRPVLETRWRGRGGRQPMRIRQRKRIGCQRESQGFIVPIEAWGQHNPGLGKGPCCVCATNEQRIRGLPWS